MNVFNTDSRVLRDTLKALKPFVDPKPHIPILGYVKLDAQDGVLNITAISGERYGTEPSRTTFTLKTSVNSRYSIAIRFDDLNKIVAKLKGDVDLNVTEQKLHLKAERLQFSINGKDAMDFPSCTNERGELIASSTLDYIDLQSELEFVSHATEKSDKQHFTNGILFDYSIPDRLKLVGTDGRRLHCTFTKSPKHQSHADQKQWILPTRWIDAFTRLNLKDASEVYLEFFENQLLWNIPSHGMSGMVSTMDTPYPDYENVIPKDRISTFKLDKKPILESLDALLPVATQDDGRDMVVVNANGIINLSARSEAFGNASAEVPCDHLSGPEIRFALNIQYLIETIKLSDETVLMSNSGELDPAVFEYPKTERIAVIMPVRLPE
jgi:DNA polymerase III beta subunit